MKAAAQVIRFERAGVRMVTIGELRLKYEFSRLMMAWAAQGEVCLMTRDAFQNIVFNATLYKSKYVTSSQRRLGRIIKNEAHAQGLYAVRLMDDRYRVRPAELMNASSSTWVPGRLFRNPKGK